jgi:hypothetical protein
MSDKNPFGQETPEWQLFENMLGARKLQITHGADALKYQKLAEQAREKEEKFASALRKLGWDGDA